MAPFGSMLSSSVGKTQISGVTQKSKKLGLSVVCAWDVYWDGSLKKQDLYSLSATYLSNKV